jgi:uncharacterized protein with LGFP repeats
VAGGIRGYWAARGAEGGLGYPTGPMTCSAGGCGQTFEIGRVVWSAGTGTHLVRGGIFETWVANGAGAGSLGHPVTEMACGLVRSGCAQHFEGGSVYWSPTTLGFAVSGAIRDHWTAQSAERGPLGYPTSVSRAVPGGTAQDFQGGTVYSDATYGTRSVSGGIAIRWRAAGAENGVLGFPTTGASCGLVRGGCTQRFFSGDHIVWSPTTGAVVITNRAATAWAAEGGPGGRLGYPRSDCQVDTVRERCLFERGYIDIDNHTGLHTAYVNG